MPSGFTIFGQEISFYGILIATAFLVGFFLAKYFCKLKGYNKDIPMDLLLFVFPFSIIGARLYYIIFSGRSWTFVEMISIWDGGLAIYGGIIASCIVIAIYCYVKKLYILDVFDFLAPCLIIGQAIGRIGCFFSNCCYGIEVTNPSLMWFPLSTQINGVWHLSTFFYESFWCIIGFILLTLLFKKTNIRGLNTGVYLAFYGVGRGIIETFRGDSLLIGSTLKVSQLLSIILVILGITLIIYSLLKNKNLKKETLVNEKTTVS